VGIYIHTCGCWRAGYSSAEVLGRNPRFMQGPESSPAAIAELGDAVRAGRPTVVELINHRRNGSKFWNQARSPFPAAICRPVLACWRQGRMHARVMICFFGRRGIWAGVPTCLHTSRRLCWCDCSAPKYGLACLLYAPAAMCAQVSLTPIRDGAGFVTNFVAVLADVTERKASEAAFQLRDHALSNLNEVRCLFWRTLMRMHACMHISPAARPRAVQPERGALPVLARARMHECMHEHPYLA
jgi:hypothetical protein